MYSSTRVIATGISALITVMSIASMERVQAATRGTDAPSITVKFPSEDLEAAPGVARLYRRIHEAAKTVCGAYDDALPDERFLWRQCVDHAVSTAVLSLHSETLSAYHRRHTGRPPAPVALAARPSAAIEP
jgi:UrcA family protein